MSGATPEDSGLASGLVNTTAQVGGAVGISVLVTLATSRTDGLLRGGSSTAAALTGGCQLAFGVSAGLAAVGALVAVTVLRGSSHEAVVADVTAAPANVNGGR
jgi:hypothetical protein